MLLEIQGNKKVILSPWKIKRTYSNLNLSTSSCVESKGNFLSNGRDKRNDTKFKKYDVLLMLNEDIRELGHMFEGCWKTLENDGNERSYSACLKDERT